jgi:ribonuclease T1
VSFSSPLAQWHLLRRWGLGVAAASFLAFAPASEARESGPTDDVAVSLSRLPPEARETHRSILAGGPFEHAKDGAVFGNREGALPSSRRGYYREYTVSTPGARDRGARRIVCGGLEPRVPDTCYYTADHYNRFHRILP